MLYKDLIQYRQQAVKNGDMIHVYIDKVNNVIYRKSWGGLIYQGMAEYMYNDNGYKALKYAIKYKNNGIKIIYEQDDNLAKALFNNN